MIKRGEIQFQSTVQRRFATGPNPVGSIFLGIMNVLLRDRDAGSMLTPLLLLLLLLSLRAQFGSSVESRSPGGGREEAYVTLLYGDEFLLGVRVLGKSIRDTGTTRDMVVLVSDGVSDYANKLLRVALFQSIEQTVDGKSLVYFDRLISWWSLYFW